jgi:hypothetical protein
MWPGMHLAHNSAKLKIFNLPKHIQLLRFGLSARADLSVYLPSDPLVGGWLPTDQRSDGGPDTKTTARSSAEPPFNTALASRACRGVWPQYSIQSLCVGGSD